MAIEAQIEIAAPPSKVREILLDFSKYPQWHTTLIKLLNPEDSSKLLSALKPGDKVKCNFDDMKFVANITANSENPFQWQGPLVHGLIKFMGPISFLMTPSVLGKKMVRQYNKFNSDLKYYAEAPG
ncbi:hypothetical protein BGW36DRAFT_443635 [Talaromyces proteolyticus]|uniref:Uncharacterized protein n=1 Tax=Talaromyces proteolyticus TaxID=1131652 RepID=A0AAD4KZE8_9EURO|nr:uncharacterized protein BGW36DRAFT_443635 [Talaromyces proteolyticus]KAH8703433.1 hypothetical protein BGW36DRAFT_443635 [Talaromyces proteolyticus]